MKCKFLGYCRILEAKYLAQSFHPPSQSMTRPGLTLVWEMRLTLRVRGHCPQSWVHSSLATLAWTPDVGSRRRCQFRVQRRGLWAQCPHRPHTARLSQSTHLLPQRPPQPINHQRQLDDDPTLAGVSRGRTLRLRANEAWQEGFRPPTPPRLKTWPRHSPRTGGGLGLSGGGEGGLSHLVGGAAPETGIRVRKVAEDPASACA